MDRARLRPRSAGLVTHVAALAAACAPALLQPAAAQDLKILTAPAPAAPTADKDAAEDAAPPVGAALAGLGPGLRAANGLGAANGRARAADDDPAYLLWLQRAALETRMTDGPSGRYDRPRIAYGEAVAAGRFRAVVAILDGDEDPYCTGALISRDIVVTAAHCVCGPHPWGVGLGVSGHAPTARIAFAAGYVPDGVKLRSGKTTCEASTKGRDLAVFRLDRPVTGAEVPRPLRLFGPAQGAALKIGATGRMVGYGRDQYGRGGRKQEATVPVTNPDCRRLSGPSGRGTSGCKRDEMVATLMESQPGPGAAPCKGDSGGPLFLRHGNRNYLAGVVSRGTPHAQGVPWCGDLAVLTAMTPRWRTFVSARCTAMGGADCPAP